VLTLSVTATGVAPIAYQWQSDGTNVPGATNSALTLALPPMTGTNAYSVRVTNDYGDLTVSLALEVYYNYTWTTLAGSPGSPGAADGTGSVAQFRSPWGVAVDADGNVYVADYDNDTIRQITPAGVVSTLAGSPRVWGSADGRGGAALFGDPTGVAVDSVGNLYVADCGNDTIRQITPAAVVSTLAGNPEAFGNADGTGTAALFDGPQGLGVDAVGHVYVADDVNDTIRKVTPAGVVSTFAGSPGLAGIADGMGSAARFCGNGLQGVAVDGVGNVYVADTRNHTIRKITPAGLVTTLAGSPGQPGTGIGANGAVRFNSPAGVTVDARGVVYVGDTGNERIVKGMPPAPSNLVAGSYALATLAGQTNTLAVASLLQTWTTPQGDLLAISAVSPTSSQGGVVQLAGSTLTYTPATGFVGTDSFTYTVFDSRGASTQGTVTVTVIAATIDPTLAISLLPFNSVALRFAGVPGIAYHVEASTDLVHWAEIGTATAVTNGWFEFIDPAANLSTARFYRTRVP
jgi:streptogramin lyase